MPTYSSKRTFFTAEEQAILRDHQEQFRDSDSGQRRKLIQSVTKELARLSGIDGKKGSEGKREVARCKYQMIKKVSMFIILCFSI